MYNTYPGWQVRIWCELIVFTFIQRNGCGEVVITEVHASLSLSGEQLRGFAGLSGFYFAPRASDYGLCPLIIFLFSYILISICQDDKNHGIVTFWHLKVYLWLDIWCHFNQTHHHNEISGWRGFIILSSPSPQSLKSPNPKNPNSPQPISPRQPKSPKGNWGWH